MPTVQELRHEMGVSLGTLNTALREAERQNILTRRHSVGIYVSPLIRKNVALICNPAFFRAADHSPFWDLLLDNVLEPSENFPHVTCHFAVEATATAPLPLALMEEISSGRIDGVLAVSIGEEAPRWIMAQGVPLVHLFGPGHVIIMPDEQAMMWDAGLLLGAQSCRRIGLWLPVPRGEPSEFSLGRQARNQEAFRQALHQQGVALDPALVVGSTAASGALSGTSTPVSNLEQGYRTALRIFGADSAVSRPDGIFISDDTMTSGALIGLQKAGVNIGTELRIVSHANRSSSVLLGQEDKLTRVEFDPAEYVDAMFTHLRALIDMSTLPSSQLTLIKPRVRVA